MLTGSVALGAAFAVCPEGVAGVETADVGVVAAATALVTGSVAELTTDPTVLVTGLAAGGVLGALGAGELGASVAAGAGPVIVEITDETSGG